VAGFIAGVARRVAMKRPRHFGVLVRIARHQFEGGEFFIDEIMEKDAGVMARARIDWQLAHSTWHAARHVCGARHPRCSVERCPERLVEREVRVFGFLAEGRGVPGVCNAAISLIQRSGFFLGPADLDPRRPLCRFDNLN
jgi:hypothetical protein